MRTVERCREGYTEYVMPVMGLRCSCASRLALFLSTLLPVSSVPSLPANISGLCVSPRLYIHGLTVCIGGVLTERLYDRLCWMLSEEDWRD